MQIIEVERLNLGSRLAPDGMNISLEKASLALAVSFLFLDLVVGLEGLGTLERVVRILV